MDPDAPLSGMVAVVLRNPGPTTADNLSDYIKELVALYNTDRARLGDVRFPLENATTDTVRVLDGLQHNVVAKWLDPLTQPKVRTRRASVPTPTFWPTSATGGTPAGRPV